MDALYAATLFCMHRGGGRSGRRVAGLLAIAMAATGVVPLEASAAEIEASRPNKQIEQPQLSGAPWTPIDPGTVERLGPPESVPSPNLPVFDGGEFVVDFVVTNESSEQPSRSGTPNAPFVAVGQGRAVVGRTPTNQGSVVEDVVTIDDAAGVDAGGDVGAAPQETTSDDGEQRAVDNLAVSAAGRGQELLPEVDRGERGSPLRGSARVDVLSTDDAVAAGMSRAAFFVEPDSALLSGAAPGATVRVAIGYGDFEDAYGAAWSERLQIVTFGRCWVQARAANVDPDPRRCAAPTPLSGVVRDAERRVVYVDVPVSELRGLADPRSGGVGQLVGGAPAGGEESDVLGQTGGTTGGPGFGLSASAYSALGNFATTGLSQASGWQVGLNSGSFEWSMDVDVPAAPAGPVPQVSVSYSSGAIDGLTADQNTQGGVLGVGWSLSTDAFIERRFRSCAADGTSAHDDTGDLCWAGDFNVLSMGGQSGELIRYGSDTVGIWERTFYRVRRDAGLRFTRYRNTTLGAEPGSLGKDNDEEFWHAVDLAGTEYWFGYNRASGSISAPDPRVGVQAPLTDSSGALNSVWTVPVKGNNTGEPCHGLQPSSSHHDGCHQAYRWMLDRVVDANDLAMVYGYEVQPNMYRYNGDSTREYVAGGVLKYIWYGMHRDNAARASNYLNTAQVRFDYRARCSDHQGACVNWPDTPKDMFCSTGPCTAQSPTFFNKQVLTEVTSFVRTGSGLNQVSQFGGAAFRSVYATPGGGSVAYEDNRLFLREVQRFGRDDSAVFPIVRFDSSCPDGIGGSRCGVRANRVNHHLNGASGVPALMHFRINGVLDENGKETLVLYSQADGNCLNKSSGWDTNAFRCFPRWFQPPADANGNPVPPGFVAFNKYRVDQVIERDPIRQSTSITTSYEYFEPQSGNWRSGIGWQRDSDPFTPLAQRTYSDFRGYDRVDTVVGSTRTRTYFWRGMHTTSSPTGHHEHPTPDGGSHDDQSVFAGETRAVFTLDGGDVVDRRWFLPTSISVTGQDQWGRIARRVVPQKVFAQEGNGANARHSLTQHTYGGDGRLLSTIEFGETDQNFNNQNGPTRSWASTGASDHRCTKFGYTPASNSFPEGLVYRTQTFDSANCQGTMIAETLSFYDGANDANQAPVRGQVTSTHDRFAANTGVTSGVWGAGTYASATTSYESGGWRRVESVTDARGNTTTYDYESFAGTSSISGGGNHNLQTMWVTTPLGFTEQTNFDAWGNTTVTVDPNGRSSYACYDQLHRTTRVFHPDNLPAGYSSLCSASNATNPPSIEYGYVTESYPNPELTPRGTFATSIVVWKTATRELISLPSDPWSTSTTSALTMDTWSFHDGFSRAVETQQPSPNFTSSNRVVIVERTVFNNEGRVSRVSDPFPVVRTSGAAGTGILSSPTANYPREHRYTFDSLGRQTAVRRVVSGQIIRTQSTTYPTMYQVRQHRWEYGSGASTPNLAGATTSTTDVFGNIIEERRHRTTTSSDVTNSRYDMNGHLTGVREPGGVETTYTVNSLGWLTRTDDPNNGVSTATYYATGELRATTDARGETITTNIDARGRVTQVVSGTNTSSFDDRLASYSYDPSGNRGAVAQVISYQRRNNNPNDETDPVLTVTATGFDTLGRTTNWSMRADGTDYGSFSGDEPLDDTYNFTETYTRSGQPYQTSYPAAGGLPTETITHHYSGLGYLTRISSPLAPGGNYVQSITYDNEGRTTEQLLGNGDHRLRRTYTYANDGRVAAMAAQVQGNGPNSGSYIQNDTYTYDADGNPTRINRNPTGSTNDVVECFTYDTVQRLTGAHTQTVNTSCTGYTTAASGAHAYANSYQYDSSDRITTNDGRTHTHGTTSHANCVTGTRSTKPHAITNASAGGGHPAESFTYTCTGAINTRTSAGTTTSYTWDERNRLVEVQQGNQNASFNTYAADNQRVLRRDPDWSKTVYLGNTELVWKDGWTGPAARRHYPNGITRSTFGNRLDFTANDHHNTITATLNANDGTTQHTHYEPYGEIRNGNTTNDRGYLNQTHDPTGLVYLNNRFYAPELGMFVSVDPLVAVTAQPYLYGAGSPVRFSDPSGLIVEEILKRIMLGIFAHSLIQQRYMQYHPGSIAEVGIKGANDPSIRYRSDVASLDPGNVVVDNEIKPASPTGLAAARRDLNNRGRILNGDQLSDVKPPGQPARSGFWSQERDQRGFGTPDDPVRIGFEGYEIRAWRAEAGVILYTIQGGRDDDVTWQLVKQANEAMRRERDRAFAVLAAAAVVAAAANAGPKPPAPRGPGSTGRQPRPVRVPGGAWASSLGAPGLQQLR